ncbi:MAG: hypothetical protein DRJ42_05215 [Deltaproteobacteria bacterium]|nr:MAG: hypothetical protein DRJ42_05215 [Deltaproteobacteria bacterium]
MPAIFILLVSGAAVSPMDDSRLSLLGVVAKAPNGYREMCIQTPRPHVTSISGSAFYPSVPGSNLC